MDHGTRDELLNHLSEAVGTVTAAHPVRVAIDGVPEFAAVLRAQGREVIRATIEGFLTSRSVRHPWSDSAEGWYNHSTDLEALRRVLLDPLGPGGHRRYQQAVYDRTADSTLSPPAATAAADAVLLFDGVFLQRKELLDQWDLRILVSATFENTVSRSRGRDQGPLMSANEAEQRYRRRYMPSQQFYFETVRPAQLADIIVYNDEPLHPGWETRER